MHFPSFSLSRYSWPAAKDTGSPTPLPHSSRVPTIFGKAKMGGRGKGKDEE